MLEPPRQRDHDSVVETHEAGATDGSVGAEHAAVQEPHEETYEVHVPDIDYLEADLRRAGNGGSLRVATEVARVEVPAAMRMDGKAGTKHAKWPPG